MLPTNASNNQTPAYFVLARNLMGLLLIDEVNLMNTLRLYSRLSFLIFTLFPSNLLLSYPDQTYLGGLIPPMGLWLDAEGERGRRG